MNEDERYVLQTPSEGICIVADTMLGIVVEYERYKFNETQKATMLDDITPDTTAAALARAMTDIGDWIIANHPETLLPPATLLRRRIGAAIREARTDQGMTLRELSAKCGINYGNLCRIEAGRLNTTIDSLATICDALGITVQFIKM